MYPVWKNCSLLSILTTFMVFPLPWEIFGGAICPVFGAKAKKRQQRIIRGCLSMFSPVLLPYAGSNQNPPSFLYVCFDFEF